MWEWGTGGERRTGSHREGGGRWPKGQLTIYGASNRDFRQATVREGNTILRLRRNRGPLLHHETPARRSDLMVAPFPETLQKVNQALIAVGDLPVLATPE